MSKILCIIDGMTDPGFQAESYPNLAKLEPAGFSDTTHGQEPESLGCILRILGVKQVPPFLRGYAEALGNGIPVSQNDLVLRGSWFALDESGRCTVPVSAPEKLNGSDCCCYYPVGQYKSLLIFPGMAAFLSDLLTHPPYVCIGQPVMQLSPQGCAAVSRVFHSQLSVNRCLLLWGQSVPAVLPPFPRRAAVITGTSVVKGIARLLGMDLISVPAATGDVDTDLVGKTVAAIHAAKDYPFVLLHINGADEAAHRKNTAEKQAFLQRVDALVLPMLLQSGSEVYVTADHGTDPASGIHTGGLQPVFSNSGGNGYGKHLPLFSKSGMQILPVP